MLFNVDLGYGDRPDFLKGKSTEEINQVRALVSKSVAPLLTSTTPHQNNPYGCYLQEVVCDSFAIMAGARNGNDPKRLAAAMASARHVEAVRGDISHWTASVLPAVAADAKRLMASGELSQKSVWELVGHCWEQVTSGAKPPRTEQQSKGWPVLSRLQFDGLGSAVASLKTGSFVTHDLSEEQRNAIRTLVRGYGAARLLNGATAFKSVHPDSPGQRSASASMALVSWVSRLERASERITRSLAVLQHREYYAEVRGEPALVFEKGSGTEICNDIVGVMKAAGAVCSLYGAQTAAPAREFHAATCDAEKDNRSKTPVSREDIALLSSKLSDISSRLPESLKGLQYMCVTVAKGPAGLADRTVLARSDLSAGKDSAVR